MLWAIKSILRCNMFNSKKKRKLAVVLIAAFLFLFCILRADDTDTVVKRRLNKLYAKYNLSLDDFGHTNLSGNYRYPSGKSGNGTKGLVKDGKIQQVLNSHIKQHVEGEIISKGKISFGNLPLQNADVNKEKNATKQKIQFVPKAIPLHDDNVHPLALQLPQDLQEKLPIEDNKAPVEDEEVAQPQLPLLPNKQEGESQKQVSKNENQMPDIQEEKKLETKKEGEPVATKTDKKPSLKEFLKQNRANLVNEEQKPQPEEEQANTIKDKQGRTLPKELYDLAPPVFDMVPNQFEKDIKNPCWMDEDQMVKCLPYFYIIGMPDAGSENLWQKIRQHPSVADTEIAGWHWWNRKRAKSKEDLLTSFQSYLTVGEVVVSELRKENYEMVHGEHSTSLFWDNDWWDVFYPDFQEAPEYTVADILAAVQPTVKLLVILSEPGTLVYDNYLITTKKDIASPDDFDARLVNSIDIFDECLKTHKKRTCIYQKFQNKDETVRLKWGFLSQYFSDWLKVFPLSQFKILEKTSFENSCLIELPKIYSFLELERLTMKQIRQICQTQTVVYRQPPPGSQPMAPSTKELLDAYFGPYLDELDEILSIQ